MAVPSHRSASGREGYRTPTIDDDERHARGIQPEHDGNGLFLEPRPTRACTRSAIRR
jgi:hypothetical protein